MAQQNKPGSKGFVAAYDRVVKRLESSLADVEIKSWAFLQQQIEEAVNVEQAAEQMTRDELDLLGAYVKRDMQALGHYSHRAGEGMAAFLKFDLNYLEHQVKESLLALADHTRVDQELLREQLDHDAEQYIAGELATVGTLECLECGMPHRLLSTVIIEPCQKCGANYFRRVSEPLSGES